MINIKQTFVTLLFFTSLLSFAEEANTSTTAGYISEDLIVYMHSGAGKNYRIQGTVNSGEKVQLTGESNNEYSEIITDKDRTGWIESKHVSTKPGMRYVIADLNEKLAIFQAGKSDITQQFNEAISEIDSLKSERSDLQNSISALNMDLTQTKSQLKNQDTSIKKQWFFNGAIVLGVGLLLGLILPRLFSKRKSGMENWG
ncbi:TIGR04211 family SH3 domain-containing protein [Colwellia sp. BRX10-3]|uniref:TIGR04211 family SH3 domain-containing protein n=1 Tax=Colwellia sp. BRX10-3 TaxID=2759844 RepID=UPI0015F3D603|nr:TIGR04211 family SH3 domain-containing protein [Colwellia sp. BRX10-3]MBA6390356.1 TIGR04211 family SH3 domain-containing protein [Colwellia sp. BRX10-3]